MLIALSKNWWVLLARGILAVLFGAVALFFPGLTMFLLIVMFGAYVLVDGAFAGYHAISSRKQDPHWKVTLIEGIVGVVAGVLVLAWPGIAGLTLLFIIAAWAIVTGVLEIIAAFHLHNEVKNEWMLGGAGVLSVIFGLLAIFYPWTGGLAITWLIGAYAIVFGAESLATIGNEGVGGDLLFVTAGFFWAMFGTLLRYYLVSGTRAVAVVGALSVLVYAPLYAIFVGFGGILQLSLAENLIQVVVQGLLAGVLPIFLFARAVILLGAGRAATFPALVPGFGLIIGYLALGVVPSVAQLAGLVIVVIGFRFVFR